MAARSLVRLFGVLAYSAELDVLYLYNTEHGPAISTYTTHGVRIGYTRLRQSIGAGDARNPFGDNTQIKAVGPYVALISPGKASEDGKKRTYSKIVLANPVNGDVLYSGTTRLQAEKRDVSEREMTAWWDSLLEADKESADELMWKIASGQDKAAAYVDKRIGQVRPVDEKQVGKLIEALNAEDFEERQAAFCDLAGVGPDAEPLLKKAADHPAPEVRARVKQLLEAFGKDEPATKELRREYYAVTVLARVGTPGAVDVLRRLSERGSPDQLARRAKQAIEGLNSGEEAVEKDAGADGRRPRPAPREL